MINKAFLTICLAGLFQYSYSQTQVSGSISFDTTWDLINSPYEVTGDITVEAGITLTIEAGVEISLPVFTNDIIVDGTLVAVGTAPLPIVLTGPGGINLSATSDNSVLDFIEYTGAGNVGSSTSDNTNRAGIAIRSTGSSSISNSTMNNCDDCIYISNNSSPIIDKSTFSNATDVGIQSQSGQPTITNCTIDNITFYGIQLAGGSGTIQNNNFTNNGSSGKHSALYIQNPMAGLVIENNTFTANHQDLLIHAEMANDELYDNNGLTVVQIDASTITSNTTWQKSQAPENWTYAMSGGTVNVNASTTLTIEPGVIIDPINNIQVQGTVIAQGTSSEPIQFFGDEAFTFLTNSTGSIFEFVEYYGTKSDGGGVFRLFSAAGPVTITNSLIDNCRFGIEINGQNSIINQNVISNCFSGISSTSASPIITNNTIINNRDVGVRATQGSPTISNNNFSDNGNSGDNTAIQLHNGITNPVIENNTFSNNNIDIITHPEVMDDEFFDTNGLSKVFIDNVAIQNDVLWHKTALPETWEFEMIGAVDVNTGITLTLEPGIVINSPTYFYDIDVDGTIVAAGTVAEPIRIVGPGGINLSATSVNSVIENLNWQGTGNTSTGAGDRTSGAGMSIGGSISIISNVEMDNCRTCVYIYNNATPTLNDLTLSNAFRDGMYVQSGSPTIVNSCITNSGNLGVENIGAGTVIAINNWWGDASGPFNATSNATGTGSAVTDGVTFDPWQAMNICNAVIAFDTQPQDVDQCEGTDATFSIQASGANNLQYQWQEDQGSGFSNLVDGGSISGATSPELTLTAITPSMNGFEYRCEVSGDNATDQTSASAVLDVRSSVMITTHPVDQTLSTGETANFSVTATGDNLTYQWQKEALDITGETDATLVISNVSTSDIGSYNCIVSNGCGMEASNAAVLNINNVIAITQNPVDADLCEGSDATFSITASGTSNIQYQWQEDQGAGFSNLVNGGTISGAASPNLNLMAITPLMDGFLYHCLVSGDNATDQTSTAAILAVRSAVRITADPLDQTHNTGETANFSVTATGDNLSFQWQKDAIDIPNETNANLTLIDIMISDQGDYTCVVTGTCNTAISSAAILNVIDPNISFSIIDSEQNQTIINGQPAPIDFGQTDAQQDILRSFSIENTGELTLIIDDIISSNSLFTISNIPQQVAASASQSFEITFSSSTEGVYTSTVSILTSAGSFLFTISAEVIDVATATNLIVYNAVAPNNNGKNDFLKIENIELSPNNSVQIFNRWGSKVYEATGYDNQNTRFEGRNNVAGDGELTEGTYFYVIKTEEQQLTGFLFLRR